MDPRLLELVQGEGGKAETLTAEKLKSETGQKRDGTSRPQEAQKPVGSGSQLSALSSEPASDSISACQHVSVSAFPSSGSAGRSFESLCAAASRAELEQMAADLDAWRRTASNFYHRVRAIFFLEAIHRYFLPPKLASKSRVGNAESRAESPESGAAAAAAEHRTSNIVHRTSSPDGVKRDGTSRPQDDQKTVGRGSQPATTPISASQRVSVSAFPSVGVSAVHSARIPFAGVTLAMERRFEEAIAIYLEQQEREGTSDALSSALAAAYHGLAFKTLAQQVQKTVRNVRGNQWMFRVGHPLDYPLRIRSELIGGAGAAAAEHRTSNIEHRTSNPDGVKRDEVVASPAKNRDGTSRPQRSGSQLSSDPVSASQHVSVSAFPSASASAAPSLLRPVLAEETAVRLDLSHAAWSDIFFLGMDYPEGAKVLNISVDLAVHDPAAGRNADTLKPSVSQLSARGSQLSSAPISASQHVSVSAFRAAAAPRPPVAAFLRVIDEPVLRLTSVDLGATVDITTIEDVFDFAKDYLGLLKAAVIAAGIVPAGLEGSGHPLSEILTRLCGPGLGLEIASQVRDIPKGSRLAVSTNLLGCLIAVCMRATGQTASLTGGLSESERRTIASRAILGEWLGGSGGGWQDSGGVWPGIKLIEGELARDGDIEYGTSRGRLLPRHTILDRSVISAQMRRELQDSLILVHGGMSQNVGPILEMVTEKYLLKLEREWAARQEAQQVLADIIAELRVGEVARVAELTTRNFFGPIQAIIPWASNAYTERLMAEIRSALGDTFRGFIMLGGMSGGGMGFFVDPAHKATARATILEIMQRTKAELEHALPFAMDPVVYDFEVNENGSTATLLTGADAMFSPEYYLFMVPRWLHQDPRSLPRARRAELDRFTGRHLFGGDERPLIAPLMQRILPPPADKTAGGETLRDLLAANGFDPIQHEQIRAELRAGRIGLAQNRLPATTPVEDVRPGDVVALDGESRAESLESRAGGERRTSNIEHPTSNATGGDKPKRDEGGAGPGEATGLGEGKFAGVKSKGAAAAERLHLKPNALNSSPEDVGADALRRGAVAVVTLAAGAGSRWTQGAGTVKALHPFAKLVGRHRSFLEVHLAKSRRTMREFGGAVPQVFTTSYLTHGPTEAFLQRAENFGYAGPVRLSRGRSIGLRLVPMTRDLRFAWEEMPHQQLDPQKEKVRQSFHKAMIEWATAMGEGSDYTDNTPLQCLHPVGHWYEVANLLLNGTLQDLLTTQPQLEHLLLHNIDTLGASLDPAVVGQHIVSNATLTIEVIRRRIDDRGGGLARVGGQLRLVEGLALAREEDEFKLTYYNTATTWIHIDRLLALFGVDRESLPDTERVAAGVRALAAKMPAYVTLKEVRKRWGNGQEDILPVAQFEKLWGDMTALPDVPVRYVAVSRHRGQQLKEQAQLDTWLRDGSAAAIEAICDFGG